MHAPALLTRRPVCCQRALAVSVLKGATAHAAPAVHGAWLTAPAPASRAALRACGRPAGRARAADGGRAGAQRKRVSVGHELLINPSVILLDGAAPRASLAEGLSGLIWLLLPCSTARPAPPDP
jgi:hypothetical protein